MMPNALNVEVFVTGLLAAAAAVAAVVWLTGTASRSALAAGMVAIVTVAVLVGTYRRPDGGESA